MERTMTCPAVGGKKYKELTQEQWSGLTYDNALDQTLFFARRELIWKFVEAKKIKMGEVTKMKKAAACPDFDLKKYKELAQGQWFVLAYDNVLDQTLFLTRRELIQKFTEASKTENK